MDDLKDIIARRMKNAVPNKKLHSPAHVLADEICMAFGERKRFAMYLGVINRVGVDAARRIYSRLKQDENAKNRGKLFMFLCRKEPNGPKEPADPAPDAAAPPTA